jgi:hypothetical protein
LVLAQVNNLNNNLFHLGDKDARDEQKGTNKILPEILEEDVPVVRPKADNAQGIKNPKKMMSIYLSFIWFHPSCSTIHPCPFSSTFSLIKDPIESEFEYLCGGSFGWI